MPFEGMNTKSREKAKKILPILVGRAKAGRDITYGQLAKEIGEHQRSFAYALGAIGKELQKLGIEWHEEIPAINCLVVNKGKRTPGKGINFVMPFDKFQKLTPLAKREIMREVNRDIFGYARWDDVLKDLHLHAAIPADALQPIATKAKYNHHGGTGEGPEHQVLKEFIKKHPELLDVPKSASAETEFAFASADRLDILFRHGSTWTGVEVKPSNADDVELLRGVFQCVKYRALIQATQIFEHQTLDAKVVLATSAIVPASIVTLCDLLEVALKEQIRVLAGFGKFVTMAATAGRA